VIGRRHEAGSDRNGRHLCSDGEHFEYSKTGEDEARDSKTAAMSTVGRRRNVDVDGILHDRPCDFHDRLGRSVNSYQQECENTAQNNKPQGAES